MNICLFQLKSNEYGIEYPGRRMEVLCVRQKEAIKPFVAWCWKINPVRHQDRRNIRRGNKLLRISGRSPAWDTRSTWLYEEVAKVAGGPLSQLTNPGGVSLNTSRNNQAGNIRALKQRNLSFKPRAHRYLVHKWSFWLVGNGNFLFPIVRIGSHGPN